jgi:hypothetical protein
MQAGSRQADLILSHMLRPTVSRPVLSWNKHQSGGLPDFYYSQTVVGLLMWSALSDDRTGLSLTIAAGPRQHSHSRVRVLRDSEPHLLSQIRDIPFRRLLRLAGLRWRYSTPPPHAMKPLQLNFELTPVKLQDEPNISHNVL